jgi:hypothetical protein
MAIGRFEYDFAGQEAGARSHTEERQWAENLDAGAESKRRGRELRLRLVPEDQGTPRRVIISAHVHSLGLCSPRSRVLVSPRETFPSRYRFNGLASIGLGLSTCGQGRLTVWIGRLELSRTGIHLANPVPKQAGDRRQTPHACDLHASAQLTDAFVSDYALVLQAPGEREGVLWRRTAS